MKEITKTTTKHYTILKVAMDAYTYDESFRKIRSRFRYLAAECFSCGHHFNDGEKISLAIISGSTNKVLCHKCAEDAREVGEYE